VLPTVRATFSAAQGVLTVIGDAQDNTIAVSRNAAGSILVNSGAVKVMGGTATVAKTKLIQLFGLGGRITNAVGWDVAGCGILLRTRLLPAASLFHRPRLPALSGK
jgi:hypothetical protein